ncbi:glycosyltransferase family 39 protein [Granulicella paludicola]|uniref:glycosyltransferase family 39 protein n=1 Tax=Granulicella paludicola TaxID=474951 RepID=UPI0021E03919|nr:glycosyltransferase family 39 protein [Granulicella paludicola]
MSTPQKTWQRADTFILAALLAIAAFWTAFHIHWPWTPMEDAAMLLRYSQHLAAGHGIRWSLNQAPVDGATDFLYMALIAAVSRLTHLDVVTSSRWINIVAQLLSVALIYRGARRLNASRWLAVAAALYLTTGPFIGLTNACFGAPVFGFFLLACWHFGLRYALEARTWSNAFAMAAFGLLAGLTRPEGVLIALLLLIATLYLAHTPSFPTPTDLSSRPKAERSAAERPAVETTTHLLLSYLLLFGLLGGAYFAWRWRYFGYPLPNPFYIKGDGHLYPDSVLHAAMNLITLLLPWLPLLPLGWLNPATRRLTNALLIVLIPFTLMWVLLSNANNHLSRFQYAIVPLVLMTLPVLFPLEWLAQLTTPGAPSAPTVSSSAKVGLQNPSPTNSFALKLAAVLAIVASTLYVSRITDYTETAWGMRTFAQRLAPLAPRGYTMAVTEAGALPLYSDWNTVDIIGLNDSYIAHHHHIDAAYLDRTHPELIMVHIDRSVPEQYLPNGFAQPPHPGAAYNAEFANLYAVTHGYTLAAAWGADQCNLHLYWLRPGFPDYTTVLADIRDHPYIFLDDAYLSHDYRNDMDSMRGCAAPEGPTP